MDGEFSGNSELSFVFLTFQNFAYSHDPVFVINSSEVFCLFRLRFLCEIRLYQADLELMEIHLLPSECLG